MFSSPMLNTTCSCQRVWYSFSCCYRCDFALSPFFFFGLLHFALHLFDLISFDFVFSSFLCIMLGLWTLIGEAVCYEEREKIMFQCCHVSLFSLSWKWVVLALYLRCRCCACVRRWRSGKCGDRVDTLNVKDRIASPFGKRVIVRCES